MTDFISIPYYCEENIWTFLNTYEYLNKNTYVVFISNQNKTVACLHQKNHLSEEFIIWDYHVIALEQVLSTWNVWDFNTDLEVPCNALKWLQSTFAQGLIHPDYQPYFKLIPKRIFLKTFSSDRSHMKNRDGTFKEAPPPWKCIGNGKSNLATFYDMSESQSYKIYNREQLISALDSKRLR